MARDISKEIEDAISKGDYSSAASLRDERNAKIDAQVAAGNNDWAGTKGVYDDIINAGLKGNSYDDDDYSYAHTAANTKGYSAPSVVQQAQQQANVDPWKGTDFQVAMLNAAKAGDKDGLFQQYANRVAKVADTGDDYGLNSDQYLQMLLDQYFPQQKQQQIVNPFAGGSYPSFSGTQYKNDSDQAYRDYVQAVMDLTYDKWSQGDAYQNAFSRYSNTANMNSQNILGQMAARTGGLASSYAEQVAQQQADATMADFYDYARSMYNTDRNDMLENASLLKGISDTDYGRWLDAYDMYNTDRNFDWNVYKDDRDFNYGASRDQMSDSLNAEDRAQNRIYTYIAAGGSLGDLPQSLVDQSGLTNAELSALIRQAEMKGGSGIGSVGSASGATSGNKANQDFYREYMTVRDNINKMYESDNPNVSSPQAIYDFVMSNQDSYRKRIGDEYFDQILDQVNNLGKDNSWEYDSKVIEEAKKYYNPKENIKNVDGALSYLLSVVKDYDEVINIAVNYLGIPEKELGK